MFDCPFLSSVGLLVCMCASMSMHAQTSQQSSRQKTRQNKGTCRRCTGKVRDEGTDQQKRERERTLKRKKDNTPAVMVCFSQVSPTPVGSHVGVEQGESYTAHGDFVARICKASSGGEEAGCVVHKHLACLYPSTGKEPQTKSKCKPEETDAC